MKECPGCGKCLDDHLLNCPDDGSSLITSLDGPCLIDKKYLLLRCLGKGGMGSVYLARHVELQKNFALKLIQHSGLSDSQSLARFRNEAKALGRLQHPSIVQVTDYGIDSRNGEIPYLVMEYLEGKTLLHFLREQGPQKIEQAIPLLESIASALDYAHSIGILHRDLNPKNVFLVQGESGGMQVKILDFGLARIIGEHPIKKEEEILRQPGSRPDSLQNADVTQTFISEEFREGSAELPSVELGRLTQIGMVMGTPGYIAPEIRQGQGATNASDIYSFGVLIYEILVGKLPFKDSARISPAPESLPMPSSENLLIPKELDQTILAPLQDEPDKRPEKAMTVIRLIQNAYAEYRYRIWRSKEWPKRTWIATGLTLALILLFFILQGFPFFKNFENYLSDLRFQWLPPHSPASSITLVSIDEASLQANPTLLVNRADEMGALLQQVFDAGARGIALDFLLPESWGQSESFSRLILNNQERFILASYIKEDNNLLGIECLKGLIMAALGSEERARALFGFLNVLPDPDGRIRRVQLGLKGQDGQNLLSMPANAYQILTRRILSVKQMERPSWIDFSVDWKKFQKISWKDLPAFLNQNPDLFRDKMVLVGGEYEGSQDYHRIPKKPGFQDEISGLLIQALALNTLLQNRPIHQVNALLALFPLAILFMIFSTLFLTHRKVISLGIILFIILIGYLFISVFLFIQNRQLVPIGAPFLVLILSLIAVFFIRHRLTFMAKPSLEGRKK